MKTIVIDPGHGGWDPGTTAGGLVEKEYQLDHVLRLRNMLHDMYGDQLRVVLIRDSDQPVNPATRDMPPGIERLAAELQARCNTANEIDADLLLSCHHDATGNATADGGTIYVYGPQSWVMADGNEAPKSYAMARAMEPIFREYLAKHGVRCNGIKEGDFQVLRNTEGPSVLIEMFFATNPGDAATAQTGDFKNAMCYAYALMVGAALGLERVDQRTAPQPTPPAAEPSPVPEPHPVPDQVSPWAQEAWDWAKSVGLNDGLNPKAVVTEEQLMVFLGRFETYLAAKIAASIDRAIRM